MDIVHEIWTIEKKNFLTLDSRRPWTIVHETYKTQNYTRVGIFVVINIFLCIKNHHPKEKESDYLFTSKFKKIVIYFNCTNQIINTILSGMSIEESYLK